MRGRTPGAGKFSAVRPDERGTGEHAEDPTYASNMRVPLAAICCAWHRPAVGAPARRIQFSLSRHGSEDDSPGSRLTPELTNTSHQSLFLPFPVTVLKRPHREASAPRMPEGIERLYTRGENGVCLGLHFHRERSGLPIRGKPSRVWRGELLVAF